MILYSIALSLIAAAPGAPDYPYSPVPFRDVTVTGGFWLPRFETNRTVTVGYDFQKCEETQRIANFARAGGLEPGDFEGIAYNDSDVYKVIEGAAYVLAQHDDAELDTYLDDLIAKIAAAQEDDGYLYTARTLGFTNAMTGPERWSHLKDNHELYNVGHMYEAAVAHYLATNKRSLLDVALKNADLLCSVFGPEQGQRIDIPGHEEIELGLAKLYRITHEERYLELAQFFIDMRGREDLRSLYGIHYQDHLPVLEQSEAVGHAVRAGYLFSGMADVAALTKNSAYTTAIDRIWEDVVGRKMYLTGAVGHYDHAEGFSEAYDLPNLRAYNETCAAIAMALWNHRMFLLHGDAKYVDLLEQIIYNGFLAGVSLSGDRFFYPNPLTCDMKFKFNHGSLDRNEWFGTSCCPVNVVRFIPSIAGYIYASRAEDLYVNLYIASETRIPIMGQIIPLSMQTDYPWSGEVRLTVGMTSPRPIAMRLRIPGWARNQPFPTDLYRFSDKSDALWRIQVNGEIVDAPLDGGYAVLDRTWREGDTVVLTLPMPVRRVQSHDAVKENKGRVALLRGPVVYCAEGADNNGAVLNTFIENDAEFTPTHQPALLGGVTTLEGPATALRRAEDGSVFKTSKRLTLLPYYAWCHRGPNEMAVWLAGDEARATIAPPPTITTRSAVTASYTNPGDSVGAVNDLVEPKHSSGDQGIARHTWWNHLGTREWLQYDFEKPTRVEGVEVYWFDDSGRGQCRAPESWRLKYRDGNQWRAVDAKDAYGVNRDTYNTVRIEPVVAEALRMEVTLQEGYSGGVLEWKVLGE